MILLQEEERALQGLIVQLVQNELDKLLSDAGCPAIATFSDAGKGMTLIAFDLTITLRKSPQHLVQLLLQIVNTYPGVPAAVVFQATIARLHQVATVQAAIHPWEVCLASGVPIVNRSQLRETLRTLVGGVTHPVVLIEGSSGTGRSHSWRLIKHVADAAAGIVVPCKVDLNGYVAERQTVNAVFDAVVKQLQLQVTPPTSVGATPETLAGRCAEELAHRWGQLAGKRAWLVFDSVDRDLPPEIKRFVCSLAELRLDEQLSGATLFLLGAGRDYIIDPYRLAKLERLGHFLEDELRTIAQRINAAGVKPLLEAELETWIQALVRAMQSGGFAAVADLLIDLREKVGA